VSTVDPAQPTVVGADGVWLSRLWSAAALGLTLLTVVLAVVVGVIHFPRGLVGLACAVLAGSAAWYGVRRRGWQRTVGLVAELPTHRASSAARRPPSFSVRHWELDRHMANRDRIP